MHNDTKNEYREGSQITEDMCWGEGRWVSDASKCTLEHSILVLPGTGLSPSSFTKAAGTDFISLRSTWIKARTELDSYVKLTDLFKWIEFRRKWQRGRWEIWPRLTRISSNPSNSLSLSDDVIVSSSTVPAERGNTGWEWDSRFKRHANFSGTLKNSEG